ncbi:hypothetical protein [uncultured Propionivibrio sp.]|uniref:hypothetical protein n=1 Tax=uncultured Propionivibrio sp. TaxID=426737 RepID=UPI0029C0E08A|nr:hypothetical protein [uncultured Propionivibrio sp.]
MKRDFLKHPRPAPPIATVAKLPDNDDFAQPDAAIPPRQVAATQRCNHWSPVIPPLTQTSKHH